MDLGVQALMNEQRPSEVWMRHAQDFVVAFDWDAGPTFTLAEFDELAELVDVQATAAAGRVALFGLHSDGQ